MFIIPVVECHRRRLQSYKSRSSRLPILPIVDPLSPDDQHSSQNNNIVPTPFPSYSYNVDSLPASTSTSTSSTTDEITTDSQSLPLSALHSKMSSTLMHHHHHSSTITIETNETSSSLGYHTPTSQPSTSDHPSLKDNTTIPTSSNPSSAQLLRLSERLSFSPLHSEKNGDNISFSDDKVHCSNTEVEFTEPHRSIELPYYYQIETEYDIDDAFLQMIESSVLSALANILTCTNDDEEEEDEDIRRLLLSEGMQKQQGTRVVAVYSYQVDRNECKLFLLQQYQYRYVSMYSAWTLISSQ